MRFYKGLYWLLVLNLFIKPIWIFGIDREVQNRVGYEGYGTYFSILGLSITLSFLADAGLTNMINRELSAGRSINLKSLFKTKLFHSFVYVAAVCCIAFLAEVVQWGLMIPVLIIQLLTSYLLFFRAVITAHQKFKIDAWLSVIDKTVVILLCGWVLYISVSGISMLLFLWLQVISLSIAVGVSFFIVWNISGVFTGEVTKWTKLTWQSLPFLILLLLMSGHNRLDAFLLEKLHPEGAHQTGIYASAYRLLDAGNVAGYLVASFLVPYATRYIGDVKLISSVSIALRQGLLLLSFVVVAAVFVYAPLILQWLYPTLPSYNENVLKICIATLPAYYITHVYGSLLTAKYALRSFIFIVFIAFVINVILNIFLIKQGAIGACKAAFISQYVCAACCMVAARRIISLSLKPFLLGGSLCVGFLYWVLFYMADVYRMPFVLMLSIAAGLTALLMFAGWQRIKKTQLQL